MIFKEIISYLNIKQSTVYLLYKWNKIFLKEFYHSCTSINVPKSISKSNIAKRNNITEKGINEFTKLRER